MRVWPTRLIRMHAVVAAVLALVVGAALAVIFSPGLAVLGPLSGATFFFASIRRYLARRRLVKRPFPEAWRNVLSTKVPFYAALDSAERDRFETDVRIFLAEQRIAASHGAKLDDETRVLVAASAAILGHGLPEFEWPTLRDIVVYPRAFDSDYRVEGRGGPIAGMVHAQGPILLSQNDLRMGFAAPRDGHNVALHELAHVMDMTDGHADGVPGDLAWVATAPWISVVADRLEQMRRRKGRRALRDYAGTNEAELFAVAVEAFFERPEDLRRKDPELYEMLCDYFAQDPAGSRSTRTPRGPRTASKLSK